MTLRERLTANRPKRILSIDGGGARIVMSLGFLEEIEHMLRERYDRPDLRFCDYFDLIGGTSAGALVAAVLALGMEAREVIEYRHDFANKIFRRRYWRAWEARYDERPLKQILRERFGELQLADPAIRSGLCIMTKRADTHSIWPLINHSDGKFFELNKHILLRNAVRASAAAPTFFVPVTIDVGEGERAAFVDGAPAL